MKQYSVWIMLLLFFSVPKTSATMKKSCSKSFTLRILLFVLFGFLLVFVDIFMISSSRSFGIIDVSMRVKTDLSNAFRRLMDYERAQTLKGTINGPLLIQPLEKKGVSKGDGFTLRRFNNKDMVKRLNDTSSQTDNIQRLTAKGNTDSLQYNGLVNPIIEGATDNKRKVNCNNCFNHNFKYVIDNPDICKMYSDQPPIELLIIILTVHENIHRRTALRDTWLTHTKNNTANVRYAFLLGEINDTMVQADIVKENDAFRDIIKEDFVDVYSNLTYKTLMGFKWAAIKCDVAKAVLKTDDDMFINVPNVLDIVRRNLNFLLMGVAGSCSTKNNRPNRDRKSKWYASMNSFPEKVYPNFCSGTGYLTSLNVVRRVIEISPHVPFFHLEDIYVALCIQKLGYHTKSFPGFNNIRPNLDACLFKGKLLVTAHYMSPTMIRKMWNDKCASNRSKHKT